jgi:hypothetical protein
MSEDIESVDPQITYSVRCPYCLFKDEIEENKIGTTIECSNCEGELYINEHPGERDG